MKINKSGAKLSAIVSIGEKLRQLSKDTGKQHLLLNRGVPSVVNIDLSEVVKLIEFNSAELQTYPPAQGRLDLRQAINDEFFGGKSDAAKIFLTGGGMSALDLVFQTVEVEKIMLPVYYWGAYFHITTIRQKQVGEYNSFDDLADMLPSLKNSAVVIGDPGNPLGEKYDDEKLFEVIKMLNDNGTIVFFDSPYRRIFFDNTDTFYQRLLPLSNVIVIESFSKSVGLSGQRIGFVHCNNTEFNDELAVRLMYATNGINAFSQALVLKLITTEVGRKAVAQFKAITIADVKKNVEYLRSKGFLAEEFYNGSTPVGIFAIVNMSEQELLKYYIGSVSLSFFTKSKKEYASKYARICISVPHAELVSYFDAIPAR
ncbi:pyridoxal phosphate-dependent aminotransferase [Williamwhitmania taraxaci]|uniref:Aminotransferase n=1 Tax=Williamwhitmania taraxaci TaxID=1640674 RepID=A0A1G6LTT2_9BACT|nr:pyridoxal phosphate-dependent aminotransferase [Williamwhitmania taraxaci]SDC46155.1 Aspartate/methionine/tyrosine aminotransferase [Williamwhitmania taraxaci]